MKFILDYECNGAEKKGERAHAIYPLLLKEIQKTKCIFYKLNWRVLKTREESFLIVLSGSEFK